MAAVLALRAALRYQGCSLEAASRVASGLRRFATDSHDDFKPQSKVQPGSDKESQIKKWIAENRVFIFMKGVPTAPQCGFSNLACQVLNAQGVKYGSANVLVDDGVRDGIKKFSGWPTIPQVYVDGEFIGGSDILLKMHESGDLDKLLEPIKKGTPTRK